MNSVSQEHYELYGRLHSIFRELHGLRCFCTYPCLPLTPISPQDGSGWHSRWDLGPGLTLADLEGKILNGIFMEATWERGESFAGSWLLFLHLSLQMHSRESAMSFYLHGDLHGSFTDLQGCLFFETEGQDKG